MCAYEHERDFLRIRDFLAATMPHVERVHNWRIERWQYACYFVCPMIGSDRDKQPSVEESRAGIRLWEATLRVWEDAAGALVGALTTEYPWGGDVFFQRHPDYDALLPAMLDEAEAHHVSAKTGTLAVRVYEGDAPLEALVRARGYEKHADWVEHDALLWVSDAPPVPALPPGFALRSMAEERDVERRREIFGRSFNHPDPSDWPTAFAYEELQRAPDYRPDLDLFIVAPDGRYAACCIVWYDTRNHLGILEPVGTHPEFRRRGLGSVVVLEGVRRAAALGADRVWVGSGQEFYAALNFRIQAACYTWTKAFSAS